MAELNSPKTGASPTETASATTVRTALRFGVGIGVACGLWLLGLHLTGNNAFGPKRLLVHFAVPVAVVLSQWALRRALLPGKPGLGRALGVGALTALIAATVAAASVLGLSQVAGEPALERNRQELLTIARAERANLLKHSGGEAGYQQHLAYLGQLSARDLAQNDFSKILLLGLIFALPGGIFFRE